MEYRRLGKSGLKVSALSLGSWVTFGKQVDNSEAKTLLKTAYDISIYNDTSMNLTEYLQVLVHMKI